MRRGDLLDVRVPDVVGEVIGWRAWELVGTDETPRLMSVNAMARFPNSPHEAIWPTARYFLARCPNGHIEGLPVESCMCGLYAAKSMEQLVSLGYGAYGTNGLVDKVVGQVAFSGKVIEGSQGWRAERGRVYRLWIPYEMDWSIGERLAAAYKVEVEPAQWIDGQFRTLDDLAERILNGEEIEDGDR